MNLVLGDFFEIIPSRSEALFVGILKAYASISTLQRAKNTYVRR